LNILVVCAHPDDETIGMGGTLKKLSKDHDITLLFVAEGITGRRKSGYENNPAYDISNDELESHILGNVGEQSLYSIWHGEKLNRARQIHMKHLGVQEIEPCKRCYLPRKMESDSAKIGDHFIKIDKYINREQVVGK